MALLAEAGFYVEPTVENNEESYRCMPCALTTLLKRGPAPLPGQRVSNSFIIEIQRFTSKRSSLLRQARP
ncbi:hypothetical protein D3C75_1239750 [compost metagenome]